MSNSLNLTEILTSMDPEPAYLVDRMYHKGQVILMAGEAGVGKSFLQYNLAMSLASGLPFLGLESRQTKVLYFDEENSRPDLQQYLRQIWRGLGCPSIPVLEQNLIIQHFTLASKGKDRYQGMIQIAAEVKPGLIVIDTATPVCGITNENDNGEASDAMKSLRAVKESSGPDTTLIVLKHIKFSHDPTETTTIRGAKAWLDMADAVIFHKLSVGKPRSDGLRNCRLCPSKVRAYGLRSELAIVPSWCGEEGAMGVILNPRALPPGN